MEALLQPFGIQVHRIRQIDGYISHNYHVEAENGDQFMLKHHKDPAERDLIEAENAVMVFLNGKLDLEVSHPVIDFMPQYEDESFARLLNFVSGKFLTDEVHTPELLFDFGKAIGKIVHALENFHSTHIRANQHTWDLRHTMDLAPIKEYILDPTRRKLVDYFLDQFEYFALPELRLLGQQLIHGDLNDNNVLASDNRVSGIIDFGDMCYSQRINELAIAMTYMMLDKTDPVDECVPMISGMAEHVSLQKREVLLLKYLIPARLCSSICHAERKAAAGEASEYVLMDQARIWDLLERWITLNPESVDRSFLKAAGLSYDEPNSSEIHAFRSKNFGKNLSLSFREPIHMNGATFQYMYGADGKTYLDAYNNIPHIGHSHPRVTEAISSQTRLLNTNTRYLYDSLASYSEQLLSHFPEKLNKVFFVNSGSAASDLAIRLAQTYTERQQLLVLEHGYHGNTRTGINISNYKFAGKGGQGEVSDVTTLPLPKIFQGRFETGTEYYEHAKGVISDLIQSGDKPAAFIAEPISGCGGQVPLAEGYLKHLKPYLDSNGILTIMDEVQVGFGRVGTHFWAYEAHGIEPDLVVLGKPMGNGHPMGAVVSTSQIADAFDNGMEFFSSFGGNPVSMEVGMAVLNTIEEEGLQQNALEVGRYFEGIANEFASRFPSIGDVRCRGLFLGLEMIDPETESPATELAGMIKNLMKENLILTGTDGPFDNVLKMKPPMCFTRQNVDQFFGSFESVMKGT